ncbi:hypothetical protein [Telmatospirillum sp.]|uniref:hypothetical protein n=1 Tax=Telmatospirillum sp. TaxID=2079197 RepID=UPI0028495BED|nr:hypothetical protein [Telmatospirillum sp.]MDR3439944.1 hypothetical protein [Telmatospirillum sp.]
MEVLVILANFIAMIAAMVWSDRAEGLGADGESRGFFAYRTAPASPSAAPLPHKRQRR